MNVRERKPRQKKMEKVYEDAGTTKLNIDNINQKSGNFRTLLKFRTGAISQIFKKHFLDRVQKLTLVFPKQFGINF